MPRKVILLCTLLGLCLPTALQAANIIWVSDWYDERVDGVPDDRDWVDFLIAQGHTVDNQQGAAPGNGYWRTLDAAKIAALNAADLVIISKNSNSGDYASDATETTQWNSLTSPMILLTAHFTRSSRWQWINSTAMAEDGSTPTLEAVDVHHPIFNGVNLDQQNRVDVYDQSVGSGIVSFNSVTDAGNGTLVAKPAGKDWTIVAEWDPGVAFYEGTGQIPAGKRLFFTAGTREGGGFGRGEFNLTEAGQTMFVNMVDYMVGSLVREPWVKAWLPEPADGAVNVSVPLFRWTPGETAMFHNVYFGTTPDLTEADLSAARQPIVMYFHVSSLEPGTKYYWRVDEVELDGTTHAGDVWSFSTASLVAYEPLPHDGAKWLDPATTTLEWQPGQNALTHDVYFGTDKAAVTEGAGNTFKGNQIVHTFSPGALTADTTYYWRIDEVMLDGTKRTGSVWTFTTLGPGGGLRGLYYGNASLSGDPILNRIDPQISFNWADDAPQGLVNDNFSVRWVGELDVPFMETYTFYANTDDGVRLWVNDIQLLDLWSNRRAATEAKASIDLVGGQKYPIVMEYYDAEGTAVAELYWESPSTPKDLIPQPAFSLALKASSPSPGNGVADVPQSSTLSWSAGEKATHHDIYFGDDAAVVAGATSGTAGIYQGRQAVDDTALDPGPLEWGKTYFWRVDEINASEAESPWKGTVWSFTAADFIVVDDMESYTDVEGNRIYETWIDGWTNNTGSVVGYLEAPFAERTLVHGGKQSMPLDYNNVNSPFYSEAELELSATQDWTVNEVTDLTIYVRGSGNNGADTLYVAVEDSSGKVAVALNSDSSVVQAIKWIEWKTPLSSFTGVNLARVKKVYIGVGDRNAPQPGGAGLLYIDDVRVTKPAASVQ